MRQNETGQGIDKGDENDVCPAGAKIRESLLESVAYVVRGDVLHHRIVTQSLSRPIPVVGCMAEAMYRFADCVITPFNGVSDCHLRFLPNLEVEIAERCHDDRSRHAATSALS